MPTPTRLARAVRPLLTAGLLAGACAPRGPAVIGPVRDPASAATRLREHTDLEQPLFIRFDWQLNESGARVSGRGVARVEPPYRARLDLFLENGEGVISAALVDGQLRMPPGARDDILPPPDLMWGTLGVFRPQSDARLVGGDSLEGEGMQLRYAYDDGGELSYRVVGGALDRMELSRDGHVVQWVEVSHSDGRYPAEATYRNLTLFRELKIHRSSLAVVDSFPEAIFDPVGR